MENTTFDVPLNDSDEVIELQLNKLPKYNEILYILQYEKTKLQIWVNLAFEYYKRGNSEAFVKLLESSRINANIDYENSNLDQMKAIDMLAAYNVQLAQREEDISIRNELLTKATLLYATGDKIIMYDINHVLGRGYLSLLEGNKMEQANVQFNYVLNRSVNNIPAQLGKACISFHKKDYRTALYQFKKVLRSCPRCPINVRVGMAHCFLKLGNMEKAQLGFERALNLNPMCVRALVSLAIMKLNKQTLDNTKCAVYMLSKAYTIEPNNPLVLNHLSNHYFFKKDYSKSELLARFALQYTDNEIIKAESCYQIARVFHVQENYNHAYQFYYQSTQFGSTKFVLPYFGLGQIYFHKKHFANAIKCFEKVLKVYPENYETLKILGSLYGKSSPQQQILAKKYLKKAVELVPDDIDTWIEYAQIFEPSHTQESLNAYNKALTLMHDSQREISPEILNNIAALHYRLGNLEESYLKLEESLSIINTLKSDSEYYNGLAVTINYNLARLFEKKFQFQRAETLHKNILKEHPSYIDSYIRLGCMARDRNQIYEASDWFKDALRVDNKNANVWSLIGNLHFSKKEWGPAQKKFERILKNPSTKYDSYSLIALGNIWLETLNHSSKTEAQKIRHRKLALKIYSQVLNLDPKNIWAANGIGCILAQSNHINEAKDIFFEVREATMDFCDVWLNIAHIYVKQTQYNSAILMYENCRKKFFMYDNVEVLQYLGNAYCKAKKLIEAKAVFLKAYRVAPQDLVIIYNLAYVLKNIAVQVFKDKKWNLKDILKSVEELKLAYKYFQHLSVQSGPNVKYDVHMALLEAECCTDLLYQSRYYVTEAHKVDKEERTLRQKRDKELEEFQIKRAIMKENEIQPIIITDYKEEILFKCQELKEKTKNALLIKPKKPKSKRNRKQCESDSGSSTASEANKNINPKSKKSGGKKKNGNRGTKNKNKILSSKKKHTFPNKNNTPKKQKLKIVSKAIISSSENDSTDDEVHNVIKKSEIVEQSHLDSRFESQNSDSSS